MSSLRPEFHTNLVSSIQEGVLYQQKYLYYFLGSTAPWVNDQSPPSEPPLTYGGDVSIRDNIIFFGRVSPTDTSLVIPRYNWQASIVFQQWDHTQVMTGVQFYCINSEFNVYKCLSNNNGATTTTEPQGTSPFPIGTADGYQWKFMYSVAPFKRSKFMSDEFIPVQRSLTDTFLNKGAIEQVTVNSGGSGYTDTPLTSIEIDQANSTTGSGALARVSAVDINGMIQNIEIISGGIGYTAGSTVTVESDYGVGASLQSINSVGGLLTSVQITNGGSNYKVDDAVVISVGGASLTPIISRVTGSIIDVVINNAGTGYLTNPQLVVRQFGNAGRGKFEQFGPAGAFLRAVVDSGSIRHVSIEDPGVNYPVDRATNIIVQGDGQGAVFTPIISNGIIVGIIVENAGQNYSYAKLQVVGAGAGAVLNAVLGGSDATPVQSIIEQTSVAGAIYTIKLTNGGAGYSSGTEVVITGDGFGATATAVVQSGQVTRVNMNTYGEQYTYADITFQDPARPTPSSLTDAQAYAILPPVGGHGADAPKELLADTIGVFTALRGDTLLSALRIEPQRSINGQLVIENQDYRQYGLIENPLNLTTKTRLTAKSNLVAFRVTVGSTTGLQQDASIICLRKKYKIVSIVGNEITLIQLSSVYQQPTGAFYVEGTPSVTYTIIDVLSVPQADKYSGNLLYVTNEPPFTTTDTESVAIRTYLKL